MTEDYDKDETLPEPLEDKNRLRRPVPLRRCHFAIGRAKATASTNPFGGAPKYRILPQRGAGATINIGKGCGTSSWAGPQSAASPLSLPLLQKPARVMLRTAVVVLVKLGEPQRRHVATPLDCGLLLHLSRKSTQPGKLEVQVPNLNSEYGGLWNAVSRSVLRRAVGQPELQSRSWHDVGGALV
ncbi:hypothetical protein TgHK011_000283 [Trichoderma gracile]|nr:hypothetical protein TgHK011_000283 [Trichoderma gracile]